MVEGKDAFSKIKKDSSNKESSNIKSLCLLFIVQPQSMGVHSFAMLCISWLIIFETGACLDPSTPTYTDATLDQLDFNTR